MGPVRENGAYYSKRNEDREDQEDSGRRVPSRLTSDQNDWGKDSRELIKI